MKCAVERELHGKWFYCVPHMLNRSIDVGLKATTLRETTIKPAKLIARYFRKSNEAALEVHGFIDVGFLLTVLDSACDAT